MHKKKHHEMEMEHESSSKHKKEHHKKEKKHQALKAKVAHKKK